MQLKVFPERCHFSPEFLTPSSLCYFPQIPQTIPSKRGRWSMRGKVNLGVAVQEMKDAEVLLEG